MIGIATTSSLLCCWQRPGQQVERAVELGLINSVSNSNNNRWVHTAGANLGNEAEEADEGGPALPPLPRTPQTQTPPGQAVEERGSYGTGAGEGGVAATTQVQGSRPGNERPEMQAPGAPLAQAPAQEAQEAQEAQQPAQAATPHAPLGETATGAGDSVGTSAGNGCTSGSFANASPPVLQHNGTPSAPDFLHNATAPEFEHRRTEARGFVSGAAYDAEARDPPATLGYAHVVPQAVPVASTYWVPPHAFVEPRDVPPGSHLESGIPVSQAVHAFPEQVQVSQVGVAPFFYKVALVQLVLGFFAFFLGFSQIYFPGALVSSIIAITAACITLKCCVCCNTTSETAHVNCSRTMNGVTVVSSVCGFTSALIFFFIWMYVAQLNEGGEDGSSSWSGPQQRNSLCKELQQQLNSSKPGRARMVLLLTDGYPTHGEYQVALTLPHTLPHTLPARLCQTVNVRAGVRAGGRTHSRSQARATRCPRLLASPCLYTHWPLARERTSTCCASSPLPPVCPPRPAPAPTHPHIGEGLHRTRTWCGHAAGGLAQRIHDDAAMHNQVALFFESVRYACCGNAGKCALCSGHSVRPSASFAPVHLFTGAPCC